MKLRPLPFALAGAYLYVGNRGDLIMSPFDPSIYLDMVYFTEISRRQEIVTHTSLNWSQVAQDNPHRYVDNFSAHNPKPSVVLYINSIEGWHINHPSILLENELSLSVIVRS